MKIFGIFLTCLGILFVVIGMIMASSDQAAARAAGRMYEANPAPALFGIISFIVGLIVFFIGREFDKNRKLKEEELRLLRGEVRSRRRRR